MKFNVWLSAIFLILGTLTLTANEPVAAEKASFQPFTGRVTSKRVRLRTKPVMARETVWRELEQGDLFVVVGEDEDYYAVLPSKEAKAYIYRTYVLDGVVEGTRVNVRLAPDFDAPIITQANTGDRVGGTISSLNRKWMEIDLPSSARFYVMKDYIENIGPEELYAQLEEKKKRGQRLYEDAKERSEHELAKNYTQVDLDSVHANLDLILRDFTDQEELVAKAEQLQKEVKEAYLLKKVEYYEHLDETAARHMRDKNAKLREEIVRQQQKLQTLEEKMKSHPTIMLNNTITGKMAAWHPIEKEIYHQWAQEAGGSPSIDDFYARQEEQAIFLHGRIDTYDKPVRNKPGDYMLINDHNNMPVAYLYSTMINLQDLVGHEVTIKVAERPDHHFAFPAYFVLSVEK